MDKYKLTMLLYAFLFFSASMTLIILGSNLGYEVSTKRQENPPNAQTRLWAVQKVTKGLPPVRIATQTEWREGTAQQYTTTKTRDIHWLNILSVAGFSIFMSGVLVFVGGTLMAFGQKLVAKMEPEAES